ncbi:MAG: flagellar filament outer layer protein FlaA [Spirochaetes bacterium]|nr:flagellar filament outer layer protein FlaA [Spirochaetota bacterium]
MKQMLILVVIAMLAGPLFAEESILIDFTELKADIHVRVADNDTGSAPNQNRHTMMDYAHVAGGSFTTQQKAVMRTSLAIENWEILLASSSRTVENVTMSYTKEAPSKQYGTVMGVRVHFPVEPFNSWAIIKPPFEIPAFEPQAEIGDDGAIQPSGDGITGPSRFEAPAGENGKVDRTKPAYGVVKNVGVIKSVAVNVYGLNFPHGLSTIIIDSQGNERTLFMGYLQFDGWGELIWNNPAYVQEVRNRDIRLIPLYPTSTPFIKFGGFLIQRDAAKVGGDFVTYFKDVRVIYDLAVMDQDRDIEDEALWHIILDRETARKTWEMEQFGQTQILRYLEQTKQAKEPPFNSPERGQQQQQ